MMTTRKIHLMRVAMVLAAALLSATVASAGEIDYPFAVRLTGLAPTDTAGAIVVMRDRVDVAALDRDLSRMGATRQFRHEQIVTQLKAKASQTQKELLGLLARLRGDNSRVSFRSFWIENLIYLKAPSDIIAFVARRTDVEIVFDGEMEIMVYSEVIDHGPSPKISPIDAPEPGLVAIKATDLWAKGYRGEGRLVANLDSGVDVTHPALKTRWRGYDAGVTVKEAWFDPTNRSAPYARNSHGTHVMGTICGEDGANQIGVAPGATWIAAMWRWEGVVPRILFDQDVIGAFQWAADPDGDPKTIVDVPDAICNSWGLVSYVSSHGVTKCQNLYWNVIDNCEFSGCAVVFAAGNEGTRGAASLRVPADRIASPVNTFSVGALEVDQKTVSSFSSRGPSGCDKKTAKPEVCAQGRSVRSSYPGGGYRTLSGTSMATPAVTGAIALLRQVWPHVTSQRVKEIILATCDDLGVQGEDNSYGMGRVNLVRAHDLLIAERPVVSMSVMGTIPTYEEGEDFWGHVGLANNTKITQNVRLSISFYFEGAPTSLIILPPTDVELSPGLSNFAAPLPVSLPIPTGLPTAVLDPNKWSLRATVEPRGGGKAIHQSDYLFTIMR